MTTMPPPQYDLSDYDDDEFRSPLHRVLTTLVTFGLSPTAGDPATYFTLFPAIRLHESLRKDQEFIDCQIAPGDIRAFRAYATVLRASSTAPEEQPLSFTGLKYFEDVTGPSIGLFLYCEATAAYTLQGAEWQVHELIELLKDDAKLVQLSTAEVAGL